MRNFIKTFSLILSVILIMTMCACSVFIYDNSRFDGGDTLNEELLSKIENDLYNESQTSESQKTSESQTSELEESELQESELQESDSQTTESVHSDSTIESDTEGKNDSGSTVYWTSGGSVWHTRRDCYYIKNSQNINSGTVDEAISSGKNKLCSSCQKH